MSNGDVWPWYDLALAAYECGKVLIVAGLVGLAAWVTVRLDLDRWLWSE